ncbi:MAG: flippase-like domain-containing protein [Bacteroidaceae bacterium]|nr:flippase-like domain-containing protein [Bacteroidaceae bacterium]
MNKTFKNIFFLIGLTSVVVMALTMDVSWKVLWDSVFHAGYWFLAILALWLVLYAMNAQTWLIILRESGPCPVSFLWLLKVTISGFAVNSATPIGLLGGEPYKILELKPRVGTQRATSSVLLFAMMHIFAHFWYWVTAIVLYAVLLPVNAGMAILLLAAAVFCGLGIYLFVKGYREGMVVKAIRWLGYLPGLKRWARNFAEAKAEDLQRIDEQIAELHQQSLSSFYATLALEYVGRMMQSLEIMFMLMIFGAACSWMTFVQSVLILAFTSLFANLLGFIPMQLGGREGGFAMSTAQLGLTGGTGLFISIICRVRELFFTCLGILLIQKR